MSFSYLDDEDVDLEALGFQDDGDYIPEKKKGWTARASERDIRAIQGALLPETLPAALAESMRTTAASAANSLGLFTERTMWPLSSTAAFLRRIYKGDFAVLADSIGGEEELASAFKSSLEEIFPSGSQLTPIEMLLGIAHFERAANIGCGISYIPQPKDFMDIPYMTLKQYSRAVSAADVVRRINAANNKITQ